MSWCTKLMDIKQNSELLIVQNSDICNIAPFISLWRTTRVKKRCRKVWKFQDSNKTPTVYCFREENIQYTSKKNLPLLNPQNTALLKIILQVVCIYSLSVLSSVGRSFMMSLSLIQEVLPNVYKQDSWTQAAVPIHRWISSFTVWNIRACRSTYINCIFVTFVQVS